MSFAEQLAMNVVIGVLSRLARAAPADESPLGVQLDRWAERHELKVPTSVALAATTLWSRVRGLVSPEIEGNFASMDLDPATLYDAEVADIVDSLTAGSG